MSQVDNASVPGLVLRVMQIIIVALTAGLVMFLGIVLFLRSGAAPAVNPARGPALPIISYTAFAFAAGAVPMSLIIPSVLVAQGRKAIARRSPTQLARDAGAGADDVTRLVAVYQTTLIAGAALNEGPAFLALIAYLMEGLPATLGLAGLLILGVAARFPTRARVEQWVDSQSELLSLDRQTGGI